MQSIDAGNSWQLDVPGGNPDLHMMFAHPSRPEILYASTGYGRLFGEAERTEGNAGLYRSGDHGKTWSYVWTGITPRYTRPLCVDPRPPHGVTVASAPSAFAKFDDESGAQAMLFRSNDDCATWHSLCDPAHTPSRANFHGLAPDPDIPGGVIVGTDTGELWRVGANAEWNALGSGMPLVASVLAL